MKKGMVLFAVLLVLWGQNRASASSTSGEAGEVSSGEPTTKDILKGAPRDKIFAELIADRYESFALQVGNIFWETVETVSSMFGIPSEEERQLRDNQAHAQGRLKQNAAALTAMREQGVDFGDYYIEFDSDTMNAIGRYRYTVCDLWSMMRGAQGQTLEKLDENLWAFRVNAFDNFTGEDQSIAVELTLDPANRLAYPTRTIAKGRVDDSCGAPVIVQNIMISFYDHDKIAQ